MPVRSNMATAGVVVLAVIAAGLSYAALTTTDGSTSVADEGRPSTTLSPTTSGGASVAPSPSTASSSPAVGTGVGVDAAVGPERPLSLVSATVAWRATAGDCATSVPATLERTLDGGRTWDTITSPQPQIDTLVATSRRALTVLGKNAACEQARAVSADGGQTWDTSGEGVWSRVAGEVSSPVGVTAEPCGTDPVVSLDGTTADNAYVLCDGGRIVATEDGGSSYAPRSTLPGAVGLAVGSQGTVLAVVQGTEGCDGLRVSASGDDGGTWNPGLCLEGTSVGGEPVGFDADGPRAMLVTSTTVHLTVDDGETWSAA